MKNNVITPSLSGLIIFFFLFSGCSPKKNDTADYSIQPVPFTSVELTDDFWAPKIEINRKVTIPNAFSKCVETGRIDNFALAGGLIEGEHKGDFPFDDTDIYKILEGASYALAVEYDPALDSYLDSLITLIGAAQEDDGYIYTCRTNNCGRLRRWMGDERWERLNSHELYNCGHLYEAAVAHFQATGERSLLNIAIKNANLINKVFGSAKNQKHCPSGHPIIEMALVKLFQVTGDIRYLNLARFFIDETGYGRDGHTLSQYSQDHKPIIEQDEAVGHAVRFAYLYSGITDVAAITGNQDYIKTLEKVWDNVVSKKLYITGGIGARAWGEGFGENYELPNMTAYCETCASIANVFWNYRMFLLFGESKYIDVLERTLYNGVISGVSLSGDRFFYDNPLESEGSHERAPWFGCACCPGNITRFMASVPGYVYATREENLFVNLYAGGTAHIGLENGSVKVTQNTLYPWEGIVKLIIDPEQDTRFAINLRIPGWSGNQPVSSDLYRFAEPGDKPVVIKVNGDIAKYRMKNGYAVINKNWKSGDEIEISFPMPVRKIISHQQVADNNNKIALQRGPLVYCLESIDHHDSSVLNLYIDEQVSFTPEFNNQILGGIMTIKINGYGLKINPGTHITEKVKTNLLAIPYYAWNNRGATEMMVWIPKGEKTASPRPLPTLASLSTASSSTNWTPGLNDQFEPGNSADKSKMFFYWWLKKGTEEWVQYDFPGEQTIRETFVYWLVHDHYDFSYRVPVSWKLLYKKGDQWLPVKNQNPYFTEKDQYNSVSFEPVKTTAVRLVALLQEEYSAGILEWKVN